MEHLAAKQAALSLKSWGETKESNCDFIQSVQDANVANSFVLSTLNTNSQISFLIPLY